MPALRLKVIYLCCCGMFALRLSTKAPICRQSHLKCYQAFFVLFKTLKLCRGIGCLFQCSCVASVDNKRQKWRRGVLMSGMGKQISLRVLWSCIPFPPTNILVLMWWSSQLTGKKQTTFVIHLQSPNTSTFFFLLVALILTD